MKLSLLIHFLFLVYYAYVVYVFYKLYENSCTCEKLETFKQKPEFKFLFGTSLLFLFINFESCGCPAVYTRSHSRISGQLL